MIKAGEGREIAVASDAVEELERETGIQIPYALQPTTNLYRIESLFVSTDPSDSIDDLTVDDFDEYFGHGADGLYRFGLQTESDSYAWFFLHRRIRDRPLFLRFDLIGDLRRSELYIKRINRYLFLLSDFLDEIVRRRLDVEVAETPAGGLYRIFDADGQGVIFDESLLWAGDQKKSFDKLVVKFGVAMAERPEGI